MGNWHYEKKEHQNIRATSTKEEEEGKTIIGRLRAHFFLAWAIWLLVSLFIELIREDVPLDAARNQVLVFLSDTLFSVLMSSKLFRCTRQ